MAKMWAGRTDGKTEKLADDFNSSIRFDQRMAQEDIWGSMAHATMLAAQNIISQEERDQILDGLQTIADDLKSGKLVIDETSEDIHMFIEQVLTERIGEAGKRLHTARSRNDQVALDLRLYLRGEIETILFRLRALLGTLCRRAEEEKATIMPGYTHLQRAQPITFGHYLMAYAMMFLRDCDRLLDTKKRMDVSPIGCCALAGTTYPINRRYEAEMLGFSSVSQNSLDGVSDRDFCVELLGALSILMMHLSRFCEELVLYSSWEFQFIELSDAYTTGSSIMPQKKNSDMAELIRGKTGRVYGDLFALLTVLKGLSLAYNKDLQEDKESVFDAVDTVKACLPVLCGMLDTLSVNRNKMLDAAQTGFLNATDLADYLVKKGLPFRSAYKTAGQAVALCTKKKCVLDTLSLEEYKKLSDLFDEDLYAAISLEQCVKNRISEGGTAVESVEKQIAFVQARLTDLKKIRKEEKK